MPWLASALLIGATACAVPEPSAALVAAAEPGPRQAARLALIDGVGARAALLWSIKHDDACAPRLRAVPQWRRGGQPLVAFIVSFGAAAEQVELIVDDGGTPHVAASELGAAVAWTAAPSGAPVLVVYTRAGSALSPQCRTWSDGGGLAGTPCPALDR